MKRIALGVVAGGAAAAAALLGAGMANADTTWTPNYTIDNATLVQAPGATSLTWDVPAAFTHGTTTLTGTDYVTPSMGGFNNEFVVTAGADKGAIYDQDQLFQGFTNLYYDAGASGAAPVDFIKTPFGTFNISPFASIYTPTDPKDFITSGTALQNAGLYSALDLGLKDATGEKWSPVYGPVHEVAITGSAPVWSTSAVFTGTGGTDVTLKGTDYLTPSAGGYDNTFIPEHGSSLVFPVYAQDQLFPGFTNLYYFDGVAGDQAVDFLKTPFGKFDISPLASLFIPAEYDGAVAASPLTDLQDSGLFSALDLGLPPVTP